MLRELVLGPRAPRLWLVVFVALCAATLAVALLPATRAPDGTGWDKLDHAAAFAALGVVGVLALRSGGRALMRVLVLLAVLGGLIEWLQSFVPSRQADFGDFVADLVGAVAGVAVGWLLLRALQRPPREAKAHEPR
jgi:VanZ family protein